MWINNDVHTSTSLQAVTHHYFSNTSRPLCCDRIPHTPIHIHIIINLNNIYIMNLFLVGSEPIHDISCPICCFFTIGCLQVHLFTFSLQSDLATVFVEIDSILLNIGQLDDSFRFLRTVRIFLLSTTTTTPTIII